MGIGGGFECRGGVGKRMPVSRSNWIPRHALIKKSLSEGVQL